MEVTRTLARYIVNSRMDDIPAAVRREAVRSVVNWLGCAVGACRHETVDRALAAITPFSGPAQASILGREEKVDIMHASLLNGISQPRVRFRRHASEDDHPSGGPGRIGDLSRSPSTCR